jgi:hypothetical protein
MAAVAEKARRRWFVPTPGRLLVVLLAVEGLLWVANWFRWTPKGYAVLIAIAAVGTFFFVMLGWFLAALVFKWRFQYSLLSLLVMPLAVVIAFGWLAVEMKAAREQRQTVEEIKRAGGLVSYDYQVDPDGDEIPGAKPPEPAWLRKVLGGDLFDSVTLAYLGIAEVGDAAIQHFERLTQLKWLWLGGTGVSDAGLQNLRGLTHLQKLSLYSTSVSDAGLEQLKGFSQLTELNLYDTNVTDAGVKKRQQALPKCSISH